jgi:hypothetical protein
VPVLQEQHHRMNAAIESAANTHEGGTRHFRPVVPVFFGGAAVTPIIMSSMVRAEQRGLQKV